MTSKNNETTEFNNAKQAVAETTEKLRKAVTEAKDKVSQTLSESKEERQQEAQQLSGNIQKQFDQLKQDILKYLESLRDQFNISQDGLTELKDFVKSEINIIIDDIYLLGKELSTDVNQISIKHKNHLAQTFKRSKEHTVEVWKKVSNKVDAESNLKS